MSDLLSDFTTPLGDDEEPKVTDEELEAYAQTRFEQPSETPESEETAPTEETTEEVPAPEVPEPESQEDDTTPAAPETGLTPEQIAAYVQLDNILKSNPQIAEGFSKLLSGEVAPTPEPTVPSSPADLDLEDPTVKALWDRLQAQQQQLETFQQTVAQHEQYLTRQQETTSASLVNRALTSFKDKYELDDKEAERVSNIAANLQVLPALAKGYNPETGQFESPDTLVAIERSLELAYWSDPKFREAEYQRQMQQQQQSNKKRQKLAAVSGNSGSVPRQQAVPKDETSRKQAMIAEVAEMMSGNAVSGE